MPIFEVAIGPGGAAGLFRVEVQRSGAGGPSEIVRLDLASLRAGRAELEEAVLSSAAADPVRLALAERRIRATGEELFLALLGTGEVAGRYRASADLAARKDEHLGVVLRTDTPELASLTWEAMYDPKVAGFVCRRDPLVRHIPMHTAPPPLGTRLPLRILAVISSPANLTPVNGNGEQEQLTRALAGLQAEGLVEVHWTRDASWAGLHKLLLGGNWHVVHFIGHGRYDAERDEGAIALVGRGGRAEWIEAGRFVDLLRQARPMPRLVVLSSCSGATTGDRDLFSGTGAALARGDMNAVVAMQFPISDIAAAEFAGGFYSAIARGRGVDDATLSGRIAILGTRSGPLEWVTPVVYLRGRATRLFRLPGKPALAGAV